MFVHLFGTIKYCFLVQNFGTENSSSYCGMEIPIFCAFIEAVDFGTRMLTNAVKISGITLDFKFCGLWILNQTSEKSIFNPIFFFLIFLWLWTLESQKYKLGMTDS